MKSTPEGTPPSPSAPKLAVITIGDELLAGEIKDINFPSIAERATALGLSVIGHVTVSDEREEIERAVLSAIATADAVVITGGLGPTSDDITTESVAGALGIDVERRDHIVEHIRSFFTRMGREMADENLKQADLPVGSLEIPGMGTAPGWMLEYDGTLVAVLPGVPREMELMFDTSVSPALAEKARGCPVQVTRKIMTFGAGESDVAARVSDLTAGGAVKYGFLALGGPIVVKLTACSATREETEAILDAEEMLVRERLGTLVYGIDDVAMEIVVGDLLREAKLTLATAESVTGGLVAGRITNVPGSSSYFLGGVVTYAVESKSAVLGVPGEKLAGGAVSREVAGDMADRVRDLFGSDIGLAVTGVAGPGTGGEKKPVGTVCLGLASERGTDTWEIVLPGDRPLIRGIVSVGALNALRVHLLESVLARGSH